MLTKKIVELPATERTSCFHTIQQLLGAWYTRSTAEELAMAARQLLEGLRPTHCPEVGRLEITYQYEGGCMVRRELIIVYKDMLSKQLNSDLSMRRLKREVVQEGVYNYVSTISPVRFEIQIEYPSS